MIVLCLNAGEAAISTGVLYIIATPIGNLADVSDRVREIVGLVDVLYAEDTRHTAKLCRHLGLAPRLRSLHDHNEGDRVQEVIDRLQSGDNLGLVSDAGTPLISDPGYRLVAACHQHGLRVSPVAGPSSVIAALSVCGLPTDRFSFYGFLPPKAVARSRLLEEIAGRYETSVFFESKHRIVKSLDDLCKYVGERRQLCVARELTKVFESVMRGEAQEVLKRVKEDPDEQKGEFVVVVAGTEPVENALSSQTTALLSAIAEEIAPRKAAAIVSAHTGVNKKVLYEWLVAQGSQ